MKKVLLILTLALSLHLSAQNPQNTTFLYRDTVTEIGHMRIQTTACVAYRTIGKVLLEITNLTDSFKIIYPRDISISDITGRQVVMQGRHPFVIPPKATRKCRFITESNSFKANALNVEIAAVHTSGKAENAYVFPPFVLDENTFYLIEKNIMPTVKVGPVIVKVKNFKYYPTGHVKVWLSVFYSGEKFLGVHCDKIRLQTADGKITMEAFRPRNNAFFFNKEKKELKLSLKFENPGSNAEKPGGEKLLLDDIFIEYPVDVKQEKLSFKVYKVSETDQPVKEEKEEKDQEKKEEE